MDLKPPFINLDGSSRALAVNGLETSAKRTFIIEEYIGIKVGRDMALPRA